MRSVLKKKSFWILALVAISCFHLVNNSIWLANSTDIDGVDVGNHLYYQLKFHHIFKEMIVDSRDNLVQKIREFFLLFHSAMSSPRCIYWPNFVYLTSTFFTLIFGTGMITAKLSGFIYFLILLAAIYAIGKRISGRAVGLLAAFFVSMYPLVFESSRQYSLDLPLTAMVCLACLFLLRAEHFTDLKYSLLLGVIVGAGMLIKGQFIIFFAAPFLTVLGVYFFEDSPHKTTPRVLTNFCVFLITACLIASLWWSGRIKDVLLSLSLHGSSAAKFLESGTVDRMRGVEYYLYNLKVLVFDSVGVVFSLVFAGSLFFFIRSRAKYRWLIISWLAVPLALFSLVFVVKHERFLMPVLPAIALVSAWGIGKLKDRRFRVQAIVVLAVYAVFQFYTLMFFNNWYNHQFGLRGAMPVFGSSSYGRTPYQRTPYYDREKLALINSAVKIINGQETGEAGKDVGICLIGGHIGAFEAIYWMYHFDPRISVRDWMEHYDTFYQDLPKFKYVIVASYSSDGFTWPGGREFLDLAVKNRGLNLKLAESFPGWEDNYRAFSRAEKDFKLVAVLQFNNGIAWYIHKRKDKR